MIDPLGAGERGELITIFRDAFVAERACGRREIEPREARLDVGAVVVAGKRMRRALAKLS